jgi:hypothetical protein
MIKIEDFDYIQSTELLFQVRSAQVLWADYSRILAGQDASANASNCLDRFDRERIDRWLVESAGLLSASQCEQNPVNERVEIGTEVRLAHRPVRYGRAAIVQTLGELSPLWPLLDIKGCGVTPDTRPVLSGHGTGVVGMGRAFRELFISRMLSALLKRLTPSVRPVEIISILSLNVPIRLVDRTDIACILVREPHFRPQQNREIPNRFSREMKAKIALEALFMTIGFSTAWKFIELSFENGRYTNRLDAGGAHPQLRPEFVKRILETFSDGQFYQFGLANTQMCRAISLSPLSANIIDLEHFFFRDQFTMDIWFPAHNEPLSWGFYIAQKDSRFVQPVKELLARTQALHDVFGRHIPAEQAAFAHGVHFGDALTYGATARQIFEKVSAVIHELDTALPSDVFTDPIEIHGTRIQPRKLDEWSLYWADSIMRDTEIPFLSRAD